MKKLLPFCICLITFLAAFEVKAQVWFPEGEFPNKVPEPVAFTMDNQLIFTISKYDTFQNKSYWVVCRYDGKSWTTLPGLVLNLNAEIFSMKIFDGSIYVGGNFIMDNGLFPSLARYNFKTLSWTGVAKFRQINLQPIKIMALEVFNKRLIIGGNFNNMTGLKDSLPYLVAFDGGINFSSIYSLNGCKFCLPNGPVMDLAANDSVLAIAGNFYKIKGRTSYALFLHHLNERFDTFSNTKAPIDKVAINEATTAYCSGLIGKERIIFKMERGALPVDMRFNMDSIKGVNKMVVFDSGLWVNGSVYLKGSSNVHKSTTVKFKKEWIEFSNNYPGAKSIASARGSLWAIGNSDKPLSIWNNNRYVMRLYKNGALAKIKVFHDSDNNCIQGKNERPLGKQLIKLGVLNPRYAITNEQGLVEFLILKPKDTSSFLFNLNLLRNYKPSNCGFETIKKQFVGKYMDSFQFPITRKYNINDVKVIISAPKGTQVMKGKEMQYTITLENVGSNTVSGNLTLKKDEHLVGETTIPPGNLGLTNVIWAYPNLKPGEKRTYDYYGIANDTHFVDNTLLNAQASASISSIQNDFPGDDTDSVQQLIDNKYSAFRKDIYPIPNAGDSVSYLTMADRNIRYHITFNNYSSSMVYNATITDTLDLNLDMSYIEETGSNKSYYTEIETDPNNSYRGIIIWHFPNINLTANPTKDFETTTSSSYIGFKVVMKPLSNGYIVKNTAAAFYDNQYVGKTNTAYCTVVNTAVDDVRTGSHSFLVYPNPASTQLQLNLPLNNTDKIVIFNAQGQVVKTTSINETCNNTTLDIESLNNGVYMIQIVKSGQLFYSKFIKL